MGKNTEMTIHCQINEPTIDIYISLLRQLAETSDEVFWMATLDQNQIIYISPACSKVWDCTPDSLYTNAGVWLDNIHLADRERVVNAFENRVAGKFDEQYRLMRSNGSTSWVWSRTFPIRDRSGQVLGILGISEDITERTQTQDERLYQALHSRINELAALSTVSQIINSTLDLDEMLTLITDIATRLLNAAATSVLLRMEEQDDLFFAAASGEASDYIVGKSLALGSGIGGWVIQHGQPILTADVSQDPRFLQSFDQATGFNTQAMLCVPLQVKEQTIGAISVMNKKNGCFDLDDLQLLSWLAAPAAIAIENARLYKHAQQEIIERKRAEAALAAERALLTQRVEARTAALQSANEELAKAAQLKDEFLASMSHELRTPLSTILGKTEALQDLVRGPLNERQLESLRSVEESAEHLLSLINDILDLSKIGVGKLELDIRAVSVEAVCQSSLRMVREAAHKKKIKVSYSSTFDSKVMTLRADERRLKQILMNLLSNAVKFTPEEGEVGLDVVSDAENERIYFTVWDTGIGISTEDQAKLFQPFMQLDSRLSRQYVGTGLGLSLVYRMVELHDGGISVESDSAQGSRFIVWLPWPPEEYTPEQKADPLDNPTDDLPPQAREGGHRPARDAPLILIAEDNEDSIDTLLDYLPARGYRLDIVYNGQEAVTRAQQELPDLILMDIQMPGMNGLEAIRRLRDEPDLARIPIIALTALAMPGDRERCLRAGASDYISKPYSLKGLIDAIQTHLELAGTIR